MMVNCVTADAWRTTSRCISTPTIAIISFCEVGARYVVCCLKGSRPRQIRPGREVDLPSLLESTPHARVPLCCLWVPEVVSSARFPSSRISSFEVLPHVRGPNCCPRSGRLDPAGPSPPSSWSLLSWLWRRVPMFCLSSLSSSAPSSEVEGPAWVMKLSSVLACRTRLAAFSSSPRRGVLPLDAATTDSRTSRTNSCSSLDRSSCQSRLEDLDTFVSSPVPHRRRQTCCLQLLRRCFL